MATFDMTLDTYPMAQSLNLVGAGVGAVEGSVIAMKDAVVSAQNEGARRIGNNVDKGFFMLMNSNLSQKIASCAVTMSSKLLLMKKYAQDIERTKSTMTCDYERIFRRYKKQFDSLDKEVQLRVEALDESAYKTATAFNRWVVAIRDNGAKLFTLLNEIESIATKKVGALLKSKALRTIGALDDDISENTRYAQGVTKVLGDKALGERKELFVCSIIEKAQSLNDKISYYGAFETVSDERFGKERSAAIRGINEDLLDKITWKGVTKKEKNAVRRSFEKLLEKEATSERLRTLMLKLFDASDWLCANKGSSKGAL